MTVLDARHVLTRKPHRCWGCGRRFPVGSSLQRVAGVDCGQVTSAYWCDVCQEVLAQSEYRDDDDYVLAVGELREEDPNWEAIRDRIEAKAAP